MISARRAPLVLGWRGRIRVRREEAGLRALLLLSVLCAPAQGQFGGFEWTLTGNPFGSGEIVGGTMTIVGPNNPPSPGGCSVQATWFETTTPVAITVDVDVDFEDLDIWPGPNCFDAPAWIVDGAIYYPPGSCSGIGWPSGPYHFTFDVAAGHTFGLGVYSVDCSEGPGVSHFKDLALTVHPLDELEGGLDPRLRLEVLEASSAWGVAVADAGDLDGDGSPEIVVGEPDEMVGRVRVLSASDGSLLWQVGAGPSFGSAVTRIDDVDADGLPDILVGAPKDVSASGGPGQAFVLSGADGSIVSTLTGSPLSALFGASVAGAQDLDDDGIPDLLVGAIGKLFPTKPGMVRVVSGASAATIFEIEDPGTGARFGRALLCPGDLNGDGRADIVVGATPASGPENDAPGFVLAFSGADGALLYSASSAGAFGYSLAPAGDLDGDARPDILVGAPGVDVALHNHGAVHVLSGATGAFLLTAVGPTPDRLAGRSVASGDVDGDGQLDLIVAAPAVTSGGGDTLVLSSATGALLNSLTVGSPGAHGTLVARVDDVDGDGRDDVVTGGKGVVRVWHGLHKTGAPRLTVDSTLEPDSPFVVGIDGAEPSSPGVLVIGFALLDLDVLGGTLVPSPDVLLPIATDGAGGAELAGRWPAGAPSFWSLWMQAWIADPHGPQGFSATQAWSVSTD